MAEPLDREAREQLEQFLKDATPRPWFVVGPPWNEHGAPWINAESADPHGGTFVCDLDAPDNNHEASEWERVEATAALIVAAVNALPALLAAEQRAEEAERRAEWHRQQCAGAQAVIRRMRERPDLDSMRQLAADYFSRPAARS